MNKKFLVVITAGLLVTASSAAAIAAFQKANTWHFVLGSVISGNSFEVVKRNTQKSLVLCNVIAPELIEPFGIKSRNYLQSLLEKNPKLVIKPVDETSDTLYARVKIRKDGKDIDLAKELVEKGLARTEETIEKEVAKKREFLPYLPMESSNCQKNGDQKRESLYVAETQARDSQEGMWKEEYWGKDIEERWREEERLQELDNKRKKVPHISHIAISSEMTVIPLKKYNHLLKERELIKSKCMTTPGCMEKKVKKD